MCEHGTTVDCEVWVDKTVSFTSLTERRVKPIDACIAPIVTALDAAGLYMLGSCCGHGKRPGELLLTDGRVLTIDTRTHQSDYVAARSTREMVPGE